MLKTLNLLLFLLLIWFVLLLLNDIFNTPNVVIGIFLSFLISVFCFKNKIINNKNQMLFLNFGFYRYFAKLFFANFVSSIFYIIKLALMKNPQTKSQAKIYNLKIVEKKIEYPDIFKSSFVLKTGLDCLKISQNNILIRAEDEKFYQKKEIHKMIADIENINDDNLV